MKKLWIATITVAFVISFLASQAFALEPKLLWEKDFKVELYEVGVASESADVIITKGKNEVVVYDKDGNETFHWGPRVDRHCGGVSISKDGKYFTFYSGYTEKYADEKKVSPFSDDRVHFYSGETKKELWNIKSSEMIPLIFPDGSGLLSLYPFLKVINSEGQEIYRYPQQVYDVSAVISPDSNYFAAITDSRRPLMLFKRDGTILWERGRHSFIASMSEGASYITTAPYVLPSFQTPDAENTHNGTIYDKDGNKVMEGYGIVSGNGKRLVMYYSDKISIYSLPEKELVTNLPIKIKLPGLSSPFFAAVSYDGNYLVIRDGDSLHAYDLENNEHELVTFAMMRMSPIIKITKDGKYLLLYPSVTEKILMYQLY